MKDILKILRVIFFHFFDFTSRWASTDLKKTVDSSQEWEEQIENTRDSHSITDMVSDCNNGTAGYYRLGSIQFHANKFGLVQVVLIIQIKVNNINEALITMSNDYGKLHWLLNKSEGIGDEKHLVILCKLATSFRR